jgi:hypothetical protein
MHAIAELLMSSKRNCRRLLNSTCIADDKADVENSYTTQQHSIKIEKEKKHTKALSEGVDKKIML